MRRQSKLCESNIRIRHFALTSHRCEYSLGILRPPVRTAESAAEQDAYKKNALTSDKGAVAASNDEDQGNTWVIMRLFILFRCMARVKLFYIIKKD